MIITTNIIYVISFLSLCHCIGYNIINIRNSDNISILDNVIFSIGIGLSIFITIISFIGYFGLLKPLIIKIIILVVSFFWIFWIFSKKFKFKHLRIFKLSYEHYFIILFFAFISLLYFIVAMTPTLDGDSLYGYLTMAREHYLNNTILVNDYYYGSIFPQNGQLITTIGYILGDQITGQLLVVWVMGLLCCFLIFSICKNIANSKSGLIAIIIWYGTYSVAFIAQSAKIDLAWTFFDLLAIYAFMQWHFSDKKNKKEKWIIFSGFLLGFAFGIKQVSAFTMVIILGIIIIYSLLNKDYGLAKSFKLILLFIVPISISFHWIIRTYLLAGYFFYTGGDLPNDYGVLGIFKTIWNMSMLGNVIGFEGPMGKSIGPIILCILPSILLYKKIDKRIWEILLFSLIMLILWYNGVQRARHFLPTIGLLSIICGYLVNKLIDTNKRVGQVVLILIVFCSIINIAPWAYVNFVSIDRFDYLKENDLDLYLEKNIDKFGWYPNYKMTKTVRDSLPNNIKIAALSTGNSYYLGKKFFSASPFTISFTQNEEDIGIKNFYSHLKNFGITHVFLNKYVIKSWNLDQCWLNREDFIEKYLDKICHYENQILYELK